MLRFDYTPIILVTGSYVTKTLNLNVSGSKRDGTPKHKPDRFPSIWNHLVATPMLEQAWKTPRHTVIGGS